MQKVFSLLGGARGKGDLGDSRVCGDSRGNGVIQGQGSSEVGFNVCGRPPDPPVPPDLTLLEYLELVERFGGKEDLTASGNTSKSGAITLNPKIFRDLERLRGISAHLSAVPSTSNAGLDFPPLAKDICFGDTRKSVTHQSIDVKQGEYISPKLNTSTANLRSGIQRLSFAEATKEKFSPPKFPGISYRSPDIVNGVPIVRFSSEEVEKAAAPLKWSLIGKFSKGRPTLMDILTVMKRVIKFKEEIYPVALDQRHVLIRFQNREDFIRAYVKDAWWFGGQRMRCFRWTPGFAPGLESSFVPVWVGLNGMRPHMLDQGMISSIVAPIGSFLCCHPDVIKFSRPGYVMVCVEIDMRNPLLKKIIVDNGGQLVEISVDYIRLPPFCIRCSMLGHVLEKCKRAQGNDTVTADPIPKVQRIVAQKWVRKEQIKNSDDLEQNQERANELDPISVEVEKPNNWASVVFKKLRKNILPKSSENGFQNVSPVKDLSSFPQNFDSPVKVSNCFEMLSDMPSPGIQGNTPFISGKSHTLDKLNSELPGNVLWASPRNLNSQSREAIRMDGFGQCYLNQEVGEPSGGSSQDRLWMDLLNSEGDDKFGESVAYPPYLSEWGVEDQFSAATTGMINTEIDSLEKLKAKVDSKGYESEPEIISRRMVDNLKETSVDNGTELLQGGFTYILND